MNNPKVSIGLPVYNGEPFIRDSIDSILSQTFRDFELIISDNCSTDKTEIICKEYAERDSRILYVKQSTNIGGTKNFEFVLGKATGEYFMWMAADDKLHPLFIEKLYQTMLAHHDLIVVMSDVLNVSNKDEILYTKKLDNIRIADVEKNWLSVRHIFFENPTSNVFFCIYGLFKTKELRLVELNYKNKVKYISQSEIPFLAQVSLLGKIASIPEELKIYQTHPDSAYHLEQKNLTKLQRLENFIRISWYLILIIIEAKVSICEKAKLTYTVIYTSLKALMFGILKKCYKIIRLFWV